MRSAAEGEAGARAPGDGEVASPVASPGAYLYDGWAAGDLARRLEVPRVLIFDLVSSTLDVAHTAAAAGAPAGTLVLADAQSAGRGRMGRGWTSDAGAGIWLTIIERPDPRAAASLGALPLRVGLALAPALDALAPSPIQLKWPNDVYVQGEKLAGVLAESRWRSEALEWIAIGVGINVRAPVLDPRAAVRAAGLRTGISRLAVLEAVVPALRSAAARRGPLSDEERAAFAARDLARGRRCIEPVAGRVRGIAPDGALLVEDDAGGEREARGGSLVLEMDAVQPATNPEANEVAP